MITRHRTHKSPDAPPPPAPSLNAPPTALIDQVAALKAEVSRLKRLLRFHLGRDDQP